MERMITLHIERLPEGPCLATSDDTQGLVAQGRTIQETGEIARDVAKTLIERRPYGGLLFATHHARANRETVGCPSATHPTN